MNVTELPVVAVTDERMLLYTGMIIFGIIFFAIIVQYLWLRFGKPLVRYTKGLYRSGIRNKTRNKRC
jgi:hypothetical protein